MPTRTFILCLLLAGSLSAQLTNTSLTSRLRVHIAFVTAGVCDASISVTLTSTSGPVADGFVDRDCLVELSGIPSGNYHLTVSGKTLLTTDTSDIVVESSDTRDIEVRVKRSDDPDYASASLSGPTVAAVDLKVPPRAAREFKKASEFIARQNWPKAIERLNKAIAIYPNYADAYNNLGVIYARLGDRAHEREVLLKAISINDHLAPAYVNLARVNIATGDFPAAETLLNRASALDPTDPKAVVLLAYSEYMDHHLDEAIANTRKAHSLPQSQHATAHWVAAHAFEQKHQAPEAIAELRLFLAEEQTGSRAEAVRKEIAALQIR